MKNVILLFLLLFSGRNTLHAQCTVGQDDCINTVITAIPFLNIETDINARSFGEVSVVGSTQNHNTSRNAALAVFKDHEISLAANYLPWGRRAIGKTSIYNINGSFKITEKVSTGFDLSYLNLGDVFSSSSTILSGRASEYFVSGFVAYRLTPNFSMGIKLKYFASDLGSFLNQTFSTEGVAGDFGLLYLKRKETKNGSQLETQLGLSINNLGPKVAYVSGSSSLDFIPTSLDLGGQLEWLNKDWSFRIAYQAQKLLVPTTCIGNNCDENFNGVPDYKELGAIGGIFSSFGDAPLGAKEEWREIQHRFGIGANYFIKEYLKIGLNTGYFHEHATKGNRKYLTAGIQLGIYGFNIFSVTNISTTKPANLFFQNNWSLGLAYQKSLL